MRDKLIRLGGLTDPKIQPIMGMGNEETQTEPFRYRNKASMPVSTGGLVTQKGGIVQPVHEPRIGFYRAKTHEVVDCEDCWLQSEPAMAAAAALRRFMEEDHITSYDPRWDKGLMRHLIVRTAVGTGEVMVILVINGKAIPNAPKLVRMLDEAIAEIPVYEDGPLAGVAFNLESVVVNIHKSKTLEGQILGEECITIAGKPTITEEVGGLQFEISPLSFYQVNRRQAERLYELAIAGAEIQKTDTVLDLYCGVGTITLAMAKAAGRVIGVEVEPQAVADARDNAQRNGVQNAEFFCGDAGQAARSLREQGLTPDVVVVDPPRKGLSPDVIRVLAQMSPRKIAYISCDPATLARDVALLKEQGFRLLGARAVDMFPRCAHVETVVLLSKGGVESKKVRVEFSLEDMDMSDFQDSATYT